MREPNLIMRKFPFKRIIPGDFNGCNAINTPLYMSICRARIGLYVKD